MKKIAGINFDECDNGTQRVSLSCILYMHDRQWSKPYDSEQEAARDMLRHLEEEPERYWASPADIREAQEITD